VGDLREAVDGVVETGVVAVHEQHGAAAARRHVGAEGRHEMRPSVVAHDIRGHDVFRGIVRLAALSPLDLPGLMNAGHRDVDAGIVQPCRAAAVEDLGRIGRALSRGRDEDAVVAGYVRDRRPDDGAAEEYLGLLADAAGAEQRKRQDAKHVEMHLPNRSAVLSSRGSLPTGQ
jgi:hypothetical protein